MAKLRTWQLKNNKKTKEYKTSLGSTDYDIPMFGYRSSFIILVVTFISLFLIPMLCGVIGINDKLPTVLLGGLISGFAVAYSQFFIERDKGLCRNFWIVGGLLSFFVALLIFLVVYSGILM